MISFRLISVVAIATPFVAHAALEWETREIKVEVRSNDREVVANYRFKNTGDTPVSIIDVVSSCDCTTTESLKRVYAPGETGSMKATLALAGRPGRQDETIAVITDSPGEPAVLRFSVEIQPLIAASPEMLAWRVGAEAEENSTLVVAATPLRIASLAITGTHPGGLAEARVETVEDGARYRVWARPLSTARTLNFTVSCAVTYTDGTAQDLIVYGMVRK